MELLDKQLITWLLRSTNKYAEFVRNKLQLDESRSQRNLLKIVLFVKRNKTSKILKIIADLPVTDFLYAINSMETNKSVFSELSSTLIKIKNSKFDNQVSSALKNNNTEELYIEYIRNVNLTNPLLDIITFRFFDNITKNVLIDLTCLQDFKTNFPNFYQKKKKDFDFFLNLLQEFTKSNVMSSEDFLKIYSYLKKQKNIMSLLYDCMSYAKLSVSQNLCTKLSHINTFKPLNQIEKEKLKITDEDVKIIDLRNKKFTLLVSCSNTFRDMSQNNIKAYVPKDEASIYDAISLSLVSNKSFYTYKDVDKYITYAYFNVKPEDIIHITEYDNYTTYTQGEDFVSNYRFAMKTSDDLMNFANKNRTYNEINGFLPSSSARSAKNFPNFCSSFKKPNAIICSTIPSITEITYAKKLDIPILLVEQSKCFCPTMSNKKQDENTYVEFSDKY